MPAPASPASARPSRTGWVSPCCRAGWPPTGTRILEAADGFAPAPALELSLHVQAETAAHTRGLAARLVAVCDAAMRA